MENRKMDVQKDNKGKQQKDEQKHQKDSSEAMDSTQSTSAPENKKLHDAVCELNYQLCEQLLREGSSARYTDSNDSTLLHTLATKCSSADSRAQAILTLLLDYGADIFARDVSNDTPLHIAAKDGVKEFCEILLKHLKEFEKFKINKRNKKGLTPLHYAAQQGSQSIVKYLIGEGANPNLADNQKYLPLHHAANGGYDGCCEVLSKYTETATLDKYSVSPIMLAAKKGHYWCYEKMKHLNMNLDQKDKDGNTALHMAAKSGFETFVKLLLDDAASPNIQNKQGNTPLMEAVLKNKLNCVKVLKENGTDLGIKNTNDCGVLHLAAAKMSDECTEHLLTYVEVKKMLNDKDKDGSTALHIAVKKQNEKCSTMLLDAGALPHVASGKESLLHLATKSLKMKLLEKLLASKKLEVNLTSEGNRQTPLHVAAQVGSKEMCQMLLRKGARIEALDIKKRTALHLSCFHGQTPVVRLLIKSNAKIRVKDDNGGTPLHSAAANGQLECCKILIATEKTLYKEKDKENRYAMDVASLKGHHSVFKDLLQQLPFTDISKLPQDLHDYIHCHTHEALKEKNKKIVEAIIQSKWWEVGFGDNADCDGGGGGPCSNFGELVQFDSSLAKSIMDKCIDSKDAKLFDFRIFENCYSGNDGKCPFSSETWKLKEDAEDLCLDNSKWKEQHPVTKMIHHRHLQLLEHPLTEAWLKLKWRSYARFTFTVLFVIQVFSVAVLIGYMTTVRNWKQISQYFNVSKEEFCSETLRYGTSSIRRTQPQRTLTWDSKPSHFWHLLLLFSVVMQFSVETYKAWKLGKHYLESMLAFARVPCLLFTARLLLPDSYCGFILGIKSVPVWKFGILALMMTSFHLLHTVIHLPQFSVFTIITKNFIREYMKGLLFIGMVISLFAFIFHLLLQDLRAFANWPQSVVMTVVWTLGDLGYDSIFLQDDPLDHPVLVNIIFLVFQCTVGAFTVTLIKTPSASKRDLAFYRRAARAELLLNLDVCFPWLRRQYAVGKWDSTNKIQWTIINQFESLVLKLEGTLLPRVSWTKGYLFPRVSWIKDKLMQHTAVLWLIHFGNGANVKLRLASKCERILDFFYVADEDVNYGILDDTEDQLEKLTTKMDNLVELYNQLNESCKRQNEQILQELKHELNKVTAGATS